MVYDTRYGGSIVPGGVGATPTTQVNTSTSVPASSYSGPVNMSINDTQQGANLVNANQEQAAKMGVSIPGSTYKPPPTEKPNYLPGDTNAPSTSPTNTNAQQSDAQKAQDARIAEWDRVGTEAMTAIQNIQNGTTPLTPGEQAQIDGLKAQFQQWIDQQAQVNRQAEGTTQMRGAQGGALEYDPLFQAKTVASVVSAGQAKIADLQTKEAAAVASLTQSFKDNDIAAIKDAWKTYQDTKQKSIDYFQKVMEEGQKAIKEAADAKVEADKTYYEQVTKPINDLKQIVKNNGAPKSVMDAIANAVDIDAAYEAAGEYAAQGTGMIAEYNYAKANGYTGSFSQYQTEDANRKALAGASDFSALMPTTNGLGGDTSGESILNATGLSIAAFNYLTQGVSSMSRMTAPQRLQIMKETQDWVNKKGIDLSTFQSQYDAYNTALQKNIERANKTRIMAGEVEGSAESLLDVLAPEDKTYDPLASVHGNNGRTNLRPAILLDLMSGKQVNNPFAIKYATQLQFMMNDLAGYMAAARGDNIPSESDQRDAASVISRGLSARSVEAFKNEIHANEEKVNGVVNKAVETTRKQVWDLFGVGNKYKGGTSSADIAAQQSQDAEAKLSQFYSSSPEHAQLIDEIHSKFPQISAQEAVQALGLQ